MNYKYGIHINVAEPNNKPLHSVEPGKVLVGHVLYEFAVPPQPGVTADSGGSLAHNPPS